jgi:peptide chain release factor subunit 1
LEYVTDKSPEGTQFVKGFSGLGGFLRYKVDTDHLLSMNTDEYEEDEDEDFI